MALTGIINLAERLLNESRNQTNQSPTDASAQTVNSSEDRFTPSSRTGADGATAAAAGVFQGTPAWLFSNIADFLLVQATGLPPSLPAAQVPTAIHDAHPIQQNSTPQANSPNPPPPVSGAAVPTAPVAAPAAPAATSGIQGTAQSSAVAVGVGGSAVFASANTAAASTPAANTQLQDLNTALSALGLNSSQIAQVDRIATLLKDFSPVAYASLVYQLEALAQSHAPQAPAANSNAVTPANNGAALTTGSNNSSGAFQIQSLVIQFSGFQASLPSPGANANQGNNVAQISAFNLQVQQVTLTLANGNGQTLLVQAPPTAASLPNGTPTGIAPRAKAIAATA